MPYLAFFFFLCLYLQESHCFLLLPCWSFDLHGVFHLGKGPLVLWGPHSLGTQISLLASCLSQSSYFSAQYPSRSLLVPHMCLIPSVADSTHHWLTNSWHIAHWFIRVYFIPSHSLTKFPQFCSPNLSCPPSRLFLKPSWSLSETTEVASDRFICLPCHLS